MIAKPRFPPYDFAMPDAQGRNHILAPEDDDGMSLWLTIALPSQEAASHDRGMWCAHAAVSEQELHRFYRYTDDGGQDGYATIEEGGQVLVKPGQGMAMADHAIHTTEVVGDPPAVGLAFYGYASEQFQPDWKRLADKTARKNKELERSDCLQSA